MGYSIGDPVLRYMMDALAADRMLGETTLPTYAFADYTDGNEKEVENVWLAKHVTPILYKVKSPDHDHSNLHLTLEEWANTHRDGVNGKEQIVIRHALAKPSGSTAQDDYVGRLLWALSDFRGLPAKRFADLDPPPSLEWLTPMWARRFRHDDLIRFGVSPNREIDAKLEFSLLFRPMAISHAFAELCVAGGDSFGDALSVLQGWLQPLGRPDTAVRDLDESQACEKFPVDALQFLATIVGDIAEWPPDRLPSCLKKISAAAPTIVRDPRFETLMNYARQKGLDSD